MRLNFSAVKVNTTTNQPQVCHVVASINQNTGGTAHLVADLAATIANQGISSHLFTLDYQQLGSQITPANVKLHSYPATFLSQHMRGFHPQASHALSQLASTELDLVHNHGLWMFPNLYARQAAKLHHLPLVISPHGMLESWSLKRSRIKKWLAWSLYERKNLHSATVFHATSSEEANSIRQLNLQQAIALIPNGVHLADCNQQASKEVLTELFPELIDQKWLLFFSRLHPKKGIDNLLYVWQKLAAKFSDWHLIIAGPDLIGYQAKLELLVEQFNLQQRVTFTGMLSGQQKFSALSNSDLFILPSHSENFGMVIAESLAYGVPAITTKNTPWQDLATYGCGWWVEDNQQALMIALIEAMEMSSNELQAMGEKGRNLVSVKYSWNSISRKMINLYHWILGGGEPPSFVQFYGSGMSAFVMKKRSPLALPEATAEGAEFTEFGRV
ncbi:glycosyltransferase [Hassallia byssoidea VB512170]|uniref:Glycosyltransferase n=1 Tax=Hassallia byssoidea VB512170 TaxID=1304833 RepID=A0A846H4R6_9CYAN|nr:glycosyltransferase [Hassalia byssoidea]NEU71599.1 glycosyltransferase [Hassalia byssoidea VB512170]